MQGPRFDIGDGYAFYEGPLDGGGPHGHAAFQIAIGLAGDVAVLDDGGVRHRGAALLIPPMVRHQMMASSELRTFFIEPSCVFADRLRARCGPGVTAAPELRALGEERVRAEVAYPSEDLDPRLMAAMDLLVERGAPMAGLAVRVGLSPQRLRVLSRDQLGMPLVRWRSWQRLSRAAQALRAGRPPAGAAAAGGFADQAHYTRTMREMMGLTPAAVVPLLCRSGAAGDVHGDRAGDR